MVLEGGFAGSDGCCRISRVSLGGIWGWIVGMTALGSITSNPQQETLKV